MVKAIRDFTGYPDGKKTIFKIGDPIPTDYAKELADKNPPLITKAKPQTEADIK